MKKSLISLTIVTSIFLSLVGVNVFAEEILEVESEAHVEVLESGYIENQSLRLPASSFEDNPNDEIKAWGRLGDNTSAIWILYNDGHLIMYGGHTKGLKNPKLTWKNDRIIKDITKITVGGGSYLADGDEDILYFTGDKMESLFAELPRVTEIEFTDKLNTELVTDMSNLFYKSSKLEKIDLGNIDTANVLDMSYMFGEMENLRDVNVSKLNTSSVKSMLRMFYNTPNLKTINVANWDTSSVENMVGVFEGASGVKGLNLYKWDVSNVNTMQYMFKNAKSVDSLDLMDWKTPNLRVMDGMFEGTESCEVIFANNFDTSKVIDMSNLFKGTKSLELLTMNSWDTRKVVRTDMFKDTGLEDITLGKYTIIGESNLTPIESSKYWRRDDGGAKFKDSESFMQNYKGSTNNVERYVLVEEANEGFIDASIMYLRKGTGIESIYDFSNKVDITKVLTFDPKEGTRSRAKGASNGYSYIRDTKVFINDELILETSDSIRHPLGDVILKDETLLDRVGEGKVLRIIHYYN